MAEVVLDSVSKRYDRRVDAVRSVSLRAADGEFVVLVGPSGCGKSTTLRMIAGLEDISEGTISIGGRVVNGVHPKDRDIAMVFQNYALYPHMTAYDNMAFALTLRKVPRDQVQARVRDAARMLGIEDLLSRKPAALSGGQRQRVAVGRAIVREPKAFLFDEPLSNLDARLRITMRGELKALHQRLRTTTIYVTHDQEEAMTLGDRVVVMADGIIQQAGPPLSVYRAPANRFVASFIGTPPMNFLTGKLKADGGTLLFIEGSSDPSGRPYVYRLPAKAVASLREHLNAEIVLGIRPQAFREPTAAEEKDPGITWKLPVRLVEPLGEQMDLSGATPKHRILARVSSRSQAGAGGVATLAIDPTGVHVFSAGPTGENLLKDLA